LIVGEPLDETLPALVTALLADRAPIGTCAAALAALPDEVFIQPRGFLARIFAELLPQKALKAG
jgi:hypothetical protein